MTVSLDLNSLELSRSDDPKDSGVDSLPIDAPGMIFRGMDKADITEDYPFSNKFNFRSWDRELELMRDEGITYLSATYQPEISGECTSIVTTYTPSGLLFDVNQVEITDIFKQDASTAWGCEEDISKDADIRCQTLEELKEYIASDPTCQKRQSMNELKINAKINSVCGLYFEVSKAVSDIFDHRKLTMAVWQKHIREKFGIDLPVFTYETTGKLTFVDMTTNGLKQQMPKVFTRRKYLQDSYQFLYKYLFSEK